MDFRLSILVHSARSLKFIRAQLYDRKRRTLFVIEQLCVPYQLSYRALLQGDVHSVVAVRDELTF